MYTNISDLINPTAAIAITSLGDAGLATSSSINRTGYETADLLILLSAASGSPTSGLVTITIQDSADNSTFANTSYVYTITTSNTAPSLTVGSVDLRSLKKYLKVIANAGFTDGTTPTVSVACAIILGTASSYPI